MSCQCPPGAWPSVSICWTELSRQRGWGHWHLRTRRISPSLGRTETSTMAAASPPTDFHTTPSINSFLSPYQKTSAPSGCPALDQLYKYPGWTSPALARGAGRTWKERTASKVRAGGEEQQKLPKLPLLVPPGPGRNPPQASRESAGPSDVSGSRSGGSQCAICRKGSHPLRRAPSRLQQDS